MTEYPSDEAPIVVVLRDRQSIRLATHLDEDTATTLIAVISEDPASWEEIVAYWPRYATPAVCEFADAIPLSIVSQDTAITAMESVADWYLIDMVQKRFCMGVDTSVIDRDEVFALETDDDGTQRYIVPVHLPPWWEHHTNMLPATFDSPRDEPLQIPRTDRVLLFGSEMINDLATRILSVSNDPEFSIQDLNMEDHEDREALYQKTVEVLRAWLMTPRNDLQGRCPRDLLHGAHSWSSKVAQGQLLRYEDSKAMIAVPDDVEGVASAPMGSEEVILYFGLCRELIHQGWNWCETKVQTIELGELSDYLSKVRDEWMSEPYEGGSPPSFIIECSRRRVPRGVGLAIQGINGIESKKHIPDCDCPICSMMEEGMFGIGFLGLSGERLEMDNEFAFSLYETFEEWQQKQDEWNNALGGSHESPNLFDLEVEDDEALKEEDSDPVDEFRSAWSNPMLDDPLGNGKFGQMKLAFRLAEIISDLEFAMADRDIISNLNQSFLAFVRGDKAVRLAAKQELREHLDNACQTFPKIVSKAADFQSQIDEFERTNR